MKAAEESVKKHRRIPACYPARVGHAPIPSSSKVKRITVNGNVTLPGTSVPVSVSSGAVTTIIVTAPDNTMTEGYKLTVANL